MYVCARIYPVCLHPCVCERMYEDIRGLFGLFWVGSEDLLAWQIFRGRMLKEYVIVYSEIMPQHFPVSP